MKHVLALIVSTLISLTIYGQNQCNQEDLEYLSDNFDSIQTLAFSCATECGQAPDGEACLTACFMENTPLSETCASCLSVNTICALDNCSITCFINGFDSQQCADCVSNSCLQSFYDCAGIVDNDEDGFTTLDDCDDTNPNVYPDAPGTAENIDNNCNGIIDESEVSAGCASDFNGDGYVGSSDLTLFLASYGCMGIDCLGDLNDSPGTTSADLTLFLVAFGISCN